MAAYADFVQRDNRACAQLLDFAKASLAIATWTHSMRE
jgi:hypothetical protein